MPKEDAPKTFPVRVEPGGIELECRAGEAVIRCAWRHGYYWPTICGGTADCGACRCEILDGAKNVEGENAAEAAFFRRPAHAGRNRGAVRLACCMTVTGPVTVRKRGVEKA